MVKASPLGSIYAGTVHPGRYLVLVSGDTASVEVALEAGSHGATATVFLPDVDPQVPDAMVGSNTAAVVGEALAVVETASIPPVIAAADAGVKAAAVALPTVRMADGLGGKGYALFSGSVAEVEAAHDAAIAACPSELLIGTALIPQLDEAMAVNLAADLRFLRRVRRRPEER